MDIKPIETVYNGYRFRSRLEARWAVFFDAMGIKYEYEPEGFEVDGEKYLPDFYLPEIETYVEIKRVDAFEIRYSDDCERVSFSGEESEKYAKFANKIVYSGKQFLIVFGDPLSALLTKQFNGGDGEMHLFYPAYCPAHFFLEYATESGDAFLLSPENCPEKDCRECSNNHSIQMASATSALITKAYNRLYWVTRIDDDFPVKPDPTRNHVLSAVTADALSKDGKCDFSLKLLGKHIASAEKARQARFEHGETPTGGIR